MTAEIPDMSSWDDRLNDITDDLDEQHRNEVLAEIGELAVRRQRLLTELGKIEERRARTAAKRATDRPRGTS